MIDIERYQTQVAAFRSSAAQVADLYISRLQAYTDERAATATLLEWVLEAIRPALPVLGGQIYEIHDGPTRSGTAFPERGIALLGGGQREGDKWSGKQLALFIVPGVPAAHVEFTPEAVLQALPQAMAAKLTFSAKPASASPLSSWQTTRVWLTPEAVLQEWPADKVLGALHDRLLEELEGKAVDKRDAAESRTRKLRAVLELIG